MFNLQSMTKLSPHRMSRILCVEDDAEIAQLVQDVLEESGFESVIVGSAGAMETQLARGGFDLILLDVMLPDEDGFVVCERLRQRSAIPVILVTARGELTDRVLGLELGADDYVIKPFDPSELVARIRALLRRASGNAPSAEARQRPMTFNGWQIEPATRELFDPHGLKITLTSTEFDLLMVFCRHPGKVLSREHLVEVVHGGLAGSIARSIDVHVSRIRQKIEPDPQHRSMIKTVRLGGYVFTPVVEQM